MNDFHARPIPLALSFATFLAISYVVCLTVVALIPAGWLHGPWLLFYAGVNLTWQTAVFGMVETVAYGLFVGAVFAPIFNYFNNR
ncbi:MAG: DUF5676 family membrane protein [Pseudolabrys sp.]